MQDEERAARDAERRREDQNEKALQVKEVAALDPLHGNQASGKRVEIVDVDSAGVGGVGGEGGELEQQMLYTDSTHGDAEADAMVVIAEYATQAQATLVLEALEGKATCTCILCSL